VQPSPAAQARIVDVTSVRQALDLDERLSLVPERAQVRGVFFKVTADEVARHGGAAVATYRRLSPVRSTWFFRMHPVRAYLEDVAAAATAIGASDPPSAIRTIWRNAARYGPLLNAERFLALLRATPLDAMRWMEGQRDMFANYGGWRLERRDEHYAIMHYFDEYLWIETAHRGGMEGLLRACNVVGSAESDLDSPFNGRIHVRWQPRGALER
jgi:hypothetical protein